MRSRRLTPPGPFYADLVLDQNYQCWNWKRRIRKISSGKLERLFSNFDVLGLAAVKDYFVRGETKGYLVMEDLTQGSLRTAMEKKQLPKRTPDEMVKLFSPALEHAYICTASE